MDSEIRPGNTIPDWERELLDLDFVAPPRPSTPPTEHRNPDGSTSITLTVHRCCNGCSRDLGDATVAELEAAVAGLPLPDVRTDCGCATDREQS